MSQRIFAGYLGVSDKTVEAWEAGTNRPSGAACRILRMMDAFRSDLVYGDETEGGDVLD